MVSQPHNKKGALNYPHHRGTATAFPLAAFGLSAFFFSIISGFAFPGNTSDFLLFLTIGTSAMVIASFFFLRVIPHSTYSALRPNVGRFRSDSSHLHRTKPDESRIHSENLAGGYRHNAEAVIAQSRASYDNPVSSNADSETSSLLSGSEPGDLIYPPDDAKNYSEKIDFRGIALLNRLDFWLLFSLLGLLSGTGLMTINNIGYDVSLKAKDLAKHGIDYF
ncbi:MAG: hypothetical protein M1829_002153 [Trizodia sp. TS-e1964]|nr:MAG: hypothetical protein M1829_002153 [Trizodia sp. TS-e1964]